ncbi:MAG: aldehyde dehydrogenase family protein [Gemmatimonadaceae bacterium]|nr:aldehyde dehydrogenase family protein [Gemmatimonadaceae bacterium]
MPTELDISPTSSVQSPPRRPITSRDPRSGETWRTWEHPDEATVRRRAADARIAQAGWAATPLGERLACIRRFRAALFERRDEVAALIEREVGKSRSDALAADVIVTLDLAAYYLRISRKVLRSRRETGASLAMLRKQIEIRRDPYGVVAVISPWNYPLMLAAGVIIPALIAGNAVILKPSEFSTATAELLVELLVGAGVPRDACQCLPGDGVTGATLIDAGVDKVFFTGSVRGGRAVAAACGERMIPVNLELGGNDAAIVLSDADVVATARGLLWGRFFTAGQTCVAPKRVLVEAGVYETLVAALKAEMLILTSGAGDGSHVGPVVRPEQAQTLSGQLEDAVRGGATVAAMVAQGATAQGDSWNPPALVIDVPRDARLMHEEAFGPLLALVRVRNVDDAVALANSSDFGLSASIWTRNEASRRQHCHQAAGWHRAGERCGGERRHPESPARRPEGQRRGSLPWSGGAAGVYTDADDRA